eukprot:gnl/MRDRNA2_/MRDRNA2_98281_c0_seq1.p1 gnl/MRDRNA2_/MRDRNA2_98281_c0~~gnl/MRDRNA2_/MRDRNA2_98281_c0_seq1.p1  ORF type:complete len:1333 (+),score=468.34 gnl/MRDRNA2_/MRDRNA2_98281_c0_seq1:155-4153(+)
MTEPEAEGQPKTPPLAELAPDEMKLIWKHYDTDQSGTMGLTEFEHLVKEVHKREHPQDPLPDEFCVFVWKECIKAKSLSEEIEEKQFYDNINTYWAQRHNILAKFRRDNQGEIEKKKTAELKKKQADQQRAFEAEKERARKMQVEAKKKANMQTSEVETLKSELGQAKRNADSEKDALERERKKHAKLQEEMQTAEQNLKDSKVKSAVQTAAQIRNLEAEAANVRQKKNEIFESNFAESEILRERLQKAEHAELRAVYATKGAKQEMEKEMERREGLDGKLKRAEQQMNKIKQQMAGHADVSDELLTKANDEVKQHREELEQTEKVAAEQAAELKSAQGDLTMEKARTAAAKAEIDQARIGLQQAELSEQAQAAASRAAAQNLKRQLGEFEASQKMWENEQQQQTLLAQMEAREHHAKNAAMLRSEEAVAQARMQATMMRQAGEAQLMRTQLEEEERAAFARIHQLRHVETEELRQRQELDEARHRLHDAESELANIAAVPEDERNPSSKLAKWAGGDPDVDTDDRSLLSAELAVETEAAQELEDRALTEARVAQALESSLEAAELCASREHNDRLHTEQAIQHERELRTVLSQQTMQVQKRLELALKDAEDLILHRMKAMQDARRMNNARHDEVVESHTKLSTDVAKMRTEVRELERELRIAEQESEAEAAACTTVAATLKSQAERLGNQAEEARIASNQARQQKTEEALEMHKARALEDEIAIATHRAELQQEHRQRAERRMRLSLEEVSEDVRKQRKAAAMLRSRVSTLECTVDQARHLVIDEAAAKDQAIEELEGERKLRALSDEESAEQRQQFNAINANTERVHALETMLKETRRIAEAETATQVIEAECLEEQRSKRLEVADELSREKWGYEQSLAKEQARVIALEEELEWAQRQSGSESQVVTFTAETLESERILRAQLGQQAELARRRLREGDPEQQRVLETALREAQRLAEVELMEVAELAEALEKERNMREGLEDETAAAQARLEEAMPQYVRAQALATAARDARRTAESEALVLKRARLGLEFGAAEEEELASELKRERKLTETLEQEVYDIHVEMNLQDKRIKGLKQGCAQHSEVASDAVHYAQDLRDEASERLAFLREEIRTEVDTANIEAELELQKAEYMQDEILKLEQTEQEGALLLESESMRAAALHAELQQQIATRQMQEWQKNLMKSVNNGEASFHGPPTSPEIPSQHPASNFRQNQPSASSHQQQMLHLQQQQNALVDLQQQQLQMHAQASYPAQQQQSGGQHLPRGYPGAMEAQDIASGQRSRQSSIGSLRSEVEKLRTKLDGEFGRRSLMDGEVARLQRELRDLSKMAQNT